MLYSSVTRNDKGGEKPVKRLISALLLITLFIGICPAYASETVLEDDKIFGAEIAFVKALDLMPCFDYSNFEKDMTVTRGQFARILCQLSGSKAMENTTSEFIDVASNEWAGYIYTCVENGFMNGINKYMFEPDREITVTEAVKCFVNLLGYESRALAEGGYPNGYLSVASRLKILSGIDSVNAKATREDIAKLIYNCLDVRVMYIESMGNNIDYTTDEGSTFMTEILGINKIEGVMTANGVSALNDSSASNGFVVIGNSFFRVQEGYDATPFLGHHVFAYYKTSDNLIIYVTVSEEEIDERVVFDLEDYDSFDGKKIYYYENDKKKDVTISNSTDIIVNGKVEKSFDETIFDFDNGTVCYIPSINGEDEKLIVEGWVSWYLVGVDKNREILYGSPDMRSIEGSHSIDISSMESVIIYDEYGRKADFKDLYVYTIIDICKNDDVVKIMIPPISAIDATLEMKVDTDTVMFNEAEYILSDYLVSTDACDTLEIGKKYRIFLDSFGKIAYIELAKDFAAMELGYMIASAEKDGISNRNVQIKALTNESIITVLETAKKVEFSDQYGKDFVATATELAGFLKGYTGVFGYTVNANNEIKSLHLPVLPGVYREKGRLGCCYESINQYYYYESGQTRLQGDVVFNADVPVFAYYATEKDEESKYRYSKFRSIPKSNSTSSTVRGYNYDPDSKYAVCFYYESSNQLSEKLSVNNARYIMVLECRNAIDSSGEEIIRISAHDFNQAKKADYEIEKELFDSVLSTTDGTTHAIKKGDIIMASMLSNKITNAQILYRSDMENVTDPSGSKGNILGTIGYYDANNKACSLPFIPNTEVDVRTGEVFTNVGRTTVASVYNVDDYGAVTFTTLDLSCKSYEDDYDETKHITEVVMPPATSAFSVVTYDRNKIDVRTGTLADIRPYTAVGSGCSKVLILQSWGLVQHFVLFNNEIE